MKKETRTSRRDFLKTAAATGAAVGLSRARQRAAVAVMGGAVLLHLAFVVSSLVGSWRHRRSHREPQPAG